jgi:phosphate transport system substrate-binding protein
VRFKTLLAMSCCAVLALGAAACGSDDSNPSSGGSGSSSSSSGAAKAGGTINGAGATFPAPVYQEWAARFKEDQGTTVNYQGIGSGGGIAQFSAGTVDFGATDSAMKDDEIATAP